MPRKLLSTLLLCFAVAAAPAAPPPGYYDSAQGESGPALRQALYSIIRGHTVILYDSTVNSDSVDALKILDEDPGNTNNVLLVYSGWSVPKTNFGGGWNREHLWPNSYGFDIDQTTTWPALRDLFNLRACDSGVNSSRGNKLYDASDPTDSNYRSSAHPDAPQCSADTDSWEPPDSMKGDIARALFYMDLRYAGASDKETDLILTDTLGSVVSGNPFMGRLSTLLLWHQSDPVDASEQHRNDLIFERYQHNRNPFVDQPEWVNAIYSPRLFIDAQATGVVVSWETNWTRAVLETESQPGSEWSVFPIGSTNDGSRLVVFSAATNNWQFFRLRVK